MITAISEKIVRKLVISKLIEEDETELFRYGLFITLSNLMCLFESVIFGLIFDILLENLVFYILFFPLRRYAGGIHARKEITCIFCTTFAILLSSCGIRILVDSGCHVLYLLCVTVGSFSICLLSPLATPEKPLEPEDYNYYRKKSIFLTLGAAFLAFLSYTIGKHEISASSSVSILLEGVLLFLGKAKERCCSN